jgi:hypothetical protein
VRASLVDLGLWDAKFSDPRDKAVAKALEVDADVEGRSGREGVDCEAVIVDILWLGPCRGCLRICKALASAFSCVRTKIASC